MGLDEDLGGMMKIYEIFSKKEKREKKLIYPDVYRYDSLPRELRVQIMYILEDVHPEGDLFLKTYYILTREYGSLNLIESDYKRSAREIINMFILSENNTQHVLDAVSLLFAGISDPNLYVYGDYKREDAIRELNERFREHGVGYQFESGKIIRIDSEFNHSEIVKPALNILHNNLFAGANTEFLKAHEDYRNKRYESAITESLKSFESTLKTICKIKKWKFNETDTAKKLIDTCLKNGLIPQYLESQLGAIRSLLESGVPTIRNKTSAHGSGISPRSVPELLARYVLNLTASNIVFLYEAAL